jgi:hypothetical protein
MDVWKLVVNILCLTLDVLVFIAAVINIITVARTPGSFIEIIEMIYVCIITTALFVAETIPARKLRELIGTYCRFWLKLLGRGLLYLLIGCLIFRTSTATANSTYVLAVSIVSIVMGFLFSVGHFFCNYEFCVGDLFQSCQSKV